MQELINKQKRTCHLLDFVVPSEQDKGYVTKEIGRPCPEITTNIYIADDFLAAKHCNTDKISVWIATGTMLKNKLHLLTFQESILDSL